ncbi:MAG TPA: vitamin B12 dependent-methionine synthase activation domain-containing protein, partial [Phycisphaerales bacterium]|nr:vitamin B12 dependent-methionine synthase activation domain-containing protein [Phycisphaerales bacterium]
EDFDGIVSLAREQVRRDGAHVLDVNVDYAGRDNPRDMAEVVSRVVRQVDAPLMIDSTQLATIRVALEHAGGKCIINSTNFEDGTDRFDEACRLARQFGAALVIGCIDEDPHASMARTADRKEAIARRGYERAVGLHGLRPEEVFFDPLVLPVSTGMDEDRRSALELVEGVRRITRLFPRSQIVVGLSNVSFGLRPAARVVLNSALLHELRAAGLTAAIVHASKILPENRIPAEQWGAALDLIYDRRRGAASPEADPLQRFIALFPDGPQSAGAARAAASASAPVEDRLRAHIVDGEKEGLERTLEEALGRYSPLQVINDHLLDGMKTVGDLFGSGQMQLPFVLQSAEVMKRAVAYLQPRMERVQGASKGSIVLATVKGDVHDIGKNLVDIILSNNGYTVHNLGIKQPLASILEAWRTTGADAIGLSGLLVKSVNVMEENLRELSAQGIGVPVLVGGAALTRHYAESHLRSVYRGPCLYGKDAFDGLRIMEHLAAGTVARLESEIEARLAKRSAAEETIVRSRAQRVAAAAGCAAGAPVPGGVALADRPAAGVGRSPHVPALDPDQVPTPPFWGSRVVEHVPLAEVYPFINTVALFRGQWQVKKGSLTPDAYERLLEDEISPAFESLKARCRDENLLRPAVVYGYFPCNAAAAEGEGANQLVLFDPADPERELERFTFPRQASGKRLCISDYFLPAGSGRRDVIGLHCVTVGAAASEAARALFERDAYQDYLYLHGLSVETAEALAELWHKRIRQELGIAGDDAPRVRDLFTQHYRGSRYSFGYPACPEMADQAKLWRLLRPERIGCRLTETWQIDPEQSTSAIIVHHPAAKYFAV